MWYVYLIENLVNGKLYPGKTQNVQKRWSKHKVIANGGKNKYPTHYHYLHASMAKHGIENFIITTLSSHELEAEALTEEIRLIAQYKAKGYRLYNLTDGGEGISGYTFSAESKQKMSVAKKGKPISNEARLSRLGKITSEETKQKISLAQRGEQAPSVKLTREKVIIIRQLFSQGISQTAISKQFNVSQTTISRICSYKTWI